MKDIIKSPTSLSVKITPLGKRIIVKPEEIKAKTTSGLYLPENSNNDLFSAGIVVKESLAKSEIYPIKTGDKVYFKRSYKEVESNGVKYIVVDIEDVFAVENE